MKDGRLVEAPLWDGKTAGLVAIEFNGSTRYVPSSLLFSVPDTTPDPEIELTIIPAIDRLEELQRDAKRLEAVGLAFDSGPYEELQKQLRAEAFIDFINKWGLNAS